MSVTAIAWISILVVWLVVIFLVAMGVWYAVRGVMASIFGCILLFDGEGIEIESEE
ncbi:MAG: hypothetical protein ACI4CE_07535 [Methanomethylophilus alvi]